MYQSIRTRFIVLSAIIVLAVPALNAQADHLAAPVTGVLSDGSTFEGAFRVSRFRSTRLGVIAHGLIIGTVTGADGEITEVLSNRLTVPVADIRALSKFGGLDACENLFFEMDPVDLELRDFTLSIDPFELNLKAESVNAFGSQFCTIADGFETGRFTNIVSSLNRFLTVLEDR